MFALYLAALSVSCVLIVLQFTVGMFHISMPDMPNSACTFPGTTKILQILVCYYVLSLIFICLIVLLLFDYMF